MGSCWKEEEVLPYLLKYICSIYFSYACHMCYVPLIS